MTSSTAAGVGAVAGVVSVVVFTLVHHVMISPIWWALPIMAIAGGVCGTCLAWCYVTLVGNQSGRAWASYVAMYTAMFGVLAVVSLLVYDPVTTLAVVMQSPDNVPIADSLPLVLVFTVVFAAGLTRFHRGGRRGFGVALVTTAVLMLLLGMNVSTMGLIELPTDAWLQVVEFFGLVGALGATYGLAYAGLMAILRATGPPIAFYVTDIRLRAAQRPGRRSRTPRTRPGRPPP